MRSEVAGTCSAELHSAVSRICNPLGARRLDALVNARRGTENLEFRRPADRKSALRPEGNSALLSIVPEARRGSSYHLFVLASADEFALNLVLAF